MALFGSLISRGLLVFAFVTAQVSAQTLETLEMQAFPGSFLIASNVSDALGNEFLSTDLANRQSVGLAALDAGNGRQRWKLVNGGAGWYSIVVVYGTSSSYDYLGVTDVRQTTVSVSMYPADDGTGLQRWQLVKSDDPMAKSTYYIRPYLSTNNSIWLCTIPGGTGPRSISLTTNKYDAYAATQWQPLQFEGQYNLYSGQYLSASSQTGGRAVTSSSLDDGSGFQRFQILQRVDQLFYILVRGTGSQYKYLAVMPGSMNTPPQLYLDTRASANSVLWQLAYSSGTWTFQDSRYGNYLTMPRSGSSGQFLSQSYVGDGTQNWVLQSTTGIPVGNCLASGGNHLYIKGPQTYSWTFTRGPVSTWYEIGSMSSSNAVSYLSLNADGISAPVFALQDDGSGAQRWEINKGPGGGFYVQPYATKSTAARYLSAQQGLSMASLPDGSYLQEFYITACPTNSEAAGNKTAAIVLGVLFGIFGAGLCIGGVYYVYTRKLFRKSAAEIDVEKSAELGDVAVGKAFPEGDDIFTDINNPAKPKPRAPSRCLIIDKIVPCCGVAMVAAK